ncbi:MAG: hypothetical protein J5653_08320 [Clostridiales bacterium]|nr:hypothetical protein [Clostridiales bacterium]
MNGVALFFGILMGGSLGVGVAFLIFGSLLNRSNNHGDSVGENSRYTGGIAYSAQIDKKLNKAENQSEFLNTYYVPLQMDPVFRTPAARVVRKLPKPQAPVAQPAAKASPVAVAAAATGFPSSTAFPTAPASQAVQATQVATVQAAQNYQAAPSYPTAPMGYQQAPAAPNYQAPAAPTQQDYENYQHLSD